MSVSTEFISNDSRLMFFFFQIFVNRNGPHLTLSLVFLKASGSGEVSVCCGSLGDRVKQMASF